MRRNKNLDTQEVKMGLEAYAKGTRIINSSRTIDHFVCASRYLTAFRNRFDVSPTEPDYGSIEYILYGYYVTLVARYETAIRQKIPA